jgi:hypothetical protein
LDNQKELARNNNNCVSDMDGGQRCTVDYSLLPGNPNALIRDECQTLNAQYVEVSYGAECVNTANSTITGRYFGTDSGACMSLSCSDEESIPLFEFLLAQDFEDRIDSPGTPQDCIIRSVWVTTPNVFSMNFESLGKQQEQLHDPPSRISEFIPQKGLRTEIQPQKPQVPLEQLVVSTPPPTEPTEPIMGPFVQYGIGFKGKDSENNKVTKVEVVEVAPSGSLFLRGSS